MDNQIIIWMLLVSNNLKKNVAKNGIWGAVILESNSDTHTNVDGSLTHGILKR